MARPRATVALALQSALARRAGRLLFAAFLLIYLAAAYYLSQRLGFTYRDAFSRTAKDYIAVFGRNPALADIGFVWPPLASLTILPFVLVRPLALADAFAANVSSALFGAANVALLYQVCLRLRLGRTAAVFMALVYGLNPSVLFYAANGMSETAFISGLLATAYWLLRWIERESPFSLLMLGLACSWAIMTRYEAMALAGLVAMVLVAYRVTHPPPRIEATLLAFTSPVAYSLMLWCFLQWQIMGNALYFLTNNLAAAQYTGSDKPMIGGWFLPPALAQALFAAVYTAGLFPPVVVLAPALLVWGGLKRDGPPVALTLYSLTLPAVMYLMMLRGSLAVQPRYFMPIIPTGMLLAAYAWRELCRSGRRPSALRWLLGFALALSPLMTGVYVWRQQIGERTDREALQAMVRQQGFGLHPARAMAEYVARLPRGSRILTDELTTYEVVLLSGDPAKYYLETDEDYREAVTDPNGVASHILVRNPVGDKGTLDAMTRRFPGLFEAGAPWATLEFESKVERWLPESWWKLYRITGLVPAPE